MSKPSNEQRNQQILVHQRPRPDFNSSENLTNIPLNGWNYHPWSKAAKISLKRRGLLGFINGNRRRPEEPGEVQEKWDILHERTVTLLLNSLDPQLSEMFLRYKTAEDLWKGVEKQYNNQSNNYYIFQIEREIAELTQGGKTIPELIGQVKAKYQELEIFRPTSTDMSVLQEREEQDQVYTLLSALDSSYEAIRAQILLSTDRLTFAGVSARIQQEDSRRAATNTSDRNSRLEGHAFSVVNHQVRKGKRGAGLKCSHCNRDTHLRDGCWILHPHLKPKWKGGGVVLGIRGEPREKDLGQKP